MNEFLNYSLLEFGNFNLKVTSILSLVAFLVFVFFVLLIVKKTINRTSKFDVARKYAIFSLVKYFTLVVSSVISLQILGFNLSVLLAGSAALLVGLGLGMQNLFSDYISGIIILIDSSVKVNDVIEVNGMVCKVIEINLRTTTVLTRDDKYIILPNTDLTRNHLNNWTHNDLASRFEVTVDVDYSSDVKLVMEILKTAVDNQNGILKKPAPFIRFNDYGDSSLNFCIYFWSEDVFRVENIKSEMRIRIFELFKEHNITIPFPQRVLHHVNKPN